jgi:hypothetical protein
LNHTTGEEGLYDIHLPILVGRLYGQQQRHPLMAKVISCLTAATLFILNILATVSAKIQPTPPKASLPAVDWNTLLDGSLGKLPAIWLVAQGSLLEVKRMEGKAKRDAAATVLNADPRDATIR